MKHITKLLIALLVAAAVLAPTPSSAAGATPVDLRFTTSPDPSIVGESVVLTALVTLRTGSAKPTGTVTFNAGPAPIGSAPVDENGVATLTHGFAAPASYDLTAVYSGDDSHASATTPSTHTVDVAVSRKRWAPGADRLWSTASNWEPQGPPVDGDTVVLDSGTAEMGESVLDIPALNLAHVSVVGGGHAVRAAAGVSALGIAGTVHDDSSGGAVLDTPVSLPDGDHVVDGRVALSRVVTGAGGIAKTGAGELTLAGANTYSGATTVRNGAAIVRHANGLGTADNGTSVAEGAVLVLHAGGPEPLTLDGALDFAADAVHAGAVALQGEEVTVSSTARGVLHGVVSGSARLRKTGSGTVVVGRHEGFHRNTYEGGTDIVEGTLTADAWADSFGKAPVDVRSGAVLDVAESLTMPNEIRMAANSVLTASEFSAMRGPVKLSGPVVARIPLHRSLLLYGTVSGTGPIRKEGAGNLWLANQSNASNSMTGVVSVAEGTLLTNGATVRVTLPEGAVVERGAALTVFTDNQIGDTASLVVHGLVSFAGTVERLGSLTVTGGAYLNGHHWEHDGRADFGLVHVDSLDAGSALVLGFAVEESLAPVTGGTHDAYRVAGSVTVGGRLFLNGEVPWGSSIRIIDNTGTSAVAGTFTGLPEGAQVPDAQRPTFISYRGGDGNDVTLTTPPARSGYWMLGADGAVYPFGQARWLGDVVGRLHGAAPVEIEPTTTHNGYWILLSDGSVFAFGDAVDHGSARARLEAGERATSISNNRANAYWVFTDRGRALPFGTAVHYGDMAGQRLNGPVLGSVGTPFGDGYYMVASDGGIFAFGQAKFHGSMGGTPLNGPVVGLAPDPDAAGYWLVASDGGIFAFTAPFRGSMGGRALNRPVVGMVAYGDGYLMVGSDGGIFNFSTKPFHGSLGASPPAAPIIAVAPLNEG